MRRKFRAFLPLADCIGNRLRIINNIYRKRHAAEVATTEIHKYAFNEHEMECDYQVVTWGTLNPRFGAENYRVSRVLGRARRRILITAINTQTERGESKNHAHRHDAISTTTSYSRSPLRICLLHRVTRFVVWDLTLCVRWYLIEKVRIYPASSEMSFDWRHNFASTYNSVEIAGEERRVAPRAQHGEEGNEQACKLKRREN